MQRKTVFKGSFLTKDLSAEDKASLSEAFATLHRLAEKGAISFQRNAGKTVVTPRKPDNVLTPQALDILCHAASIEADFVVSDITTATGINRNSVTAHLYRLAEAGYLARRALAGEVHTITAGRRANWVYAMSALGRDAVASLRDDPEEGAVLGGKTQEVNVRFK